MNGKFDSILTLEDGKKIWRHFQRFAEYNDLKELYTKCIPQLVKFESKLIEQADYLEKFNHILSKFDQDLITKADKITMIQFK